MFSIHASLSSAVLVTSSRLRLLAPLTNDPRKCCPSASSTTPHRTLSYSYLTSKHGAENKLPTLLMLACIVIPGSPAVSSRYLPVLFWAFPLKEVFFSLRVSFRPSPECSSLVITIVDFLFGFIVTVPLSLPLHCFVDVERLAAVARWKDKSTGDQKDILHMYFAVGFPQQHFNQFVVLAVCKGMFAA